MSWFDAYSVKARWLPTVLVVLPTASLGLVYPGVLSTTESIALSGIGFTAVLTLGGEVIRALGKHTQSRLVKRDGGLPTTRALILGSAVSDTVKKRRRAAVANVSGQILPSRKDEQRDLAEAIRRYNHAISTSISRIRSTSPEKRLLDAEVASYGFRRNMRGAKPIALVLTLANIGAIAAGWAFLATPLTTATVALGIQIVSILIWTFAVKDLWVLEQSKTYSERFFLAVELAAEEV